VAVSALAGCATTGRTAGDCYSHIYFDERYAIRGAAGPLPEQAARGPCYRFTHSPDGRVTRIDYRQNGQPAADPVLGVAAILIQQVEGAEQRTYLNANGRPAPDANGVYAVRLRYDARGYPIEWRSLDAAGRPIEAKASGLAAVRWLYDDKGRILTTLMFDRHGAPVTTRRP